MKGTEAVTMGYDQINEMFSYNRCTLLAKTVLSKHIIVVFVSIKLFNQFDESLINLPKQYLAKQFCWKEHDDFSQCTVFKPRIMEPTHMQCYLVKTFAALFNF